MSLRAIRHRARSMPALRHFYAVLPELVRIGGAVFVLIPAAFLLPRFLALAAADGVSLLLMLLPSPGLTTYQTMRKAFGKPPFQAFMLAWKTVARPFRDLVILKRVLYGRENVFDWKIVERNSDGVDRLRKSGQSFIIAVAHFQRAAVLALASPAVAPGTFVSVAEAPPKKIKSLYDLRLRLFYGTMITAIATAWRRPFEYAFTTEGQSAAALVYQRLREPGNIVLINIDAVWAKRPTGSFSGPFAGQEERTLSTGVVQLAQLTGCPIVPCSFWQDSDGTIILDWGTPVETIHDEAETMNRLIAPLETAIGERPAQYVLEIGDERRWNATQRIWEN